VTVCVEACVLALVVVDHTICAAIRTDGVFAVALIKLATFDSALQLALAIPDHRDFTLPFLITSRILLTLAITAVPVTSNVQTTQVTNAVSNVSLVTVIIAAARGWIPFAVSSIKPTGTVLALLLTSPVV
jgi:hypothetical protein